MSQTRTSKQGQPELHPDAVSGHAPRYWTRRDWLTRAGGGAGMVALASMLNQQAIADQKPERTIDQGPDPLKPLEPRAGHFNGKAKSVIWLFMEGAPSAVDLFDPKPELTRRHGVKTDIKAFFGNPGPLMKSPFKFKKYGECGQPVSEHYTNVAKHVDDMAFIKSCYTESDNHVPAIYQINSGLPRPGFPTAGAWVTYGLGTENQNLPGYVVLGNTQGAKGGPHNWGAGFLPTTFQGTLFRNSGPPILNLKRQAGVSEKDQRAQLDLMKRLNQRHLDRHQSETDLLARIQSFELAYRMQKEAMQVVDINRETEATKRLYGIDNGRSQSYGTKCLMARRLIENGVRFVQVYSDGEWDAHNNLTQNHTHHCQATDVPISGLLTDLKQRGMLEDTLVIWGGEFGRMPISQNGNGRDHNPNGFLQWMAGGGVKGGISHGELDDIGYAAAVDRVSVNDFHATLLHLMGIDHEKLTYFHNGRKYRLTDVAGKVIRPILS